MKKNKKARVLYLIYELACDNMMWINQKLTSFEHNKVDRIYQKKGFAAAFDYRRKCDRKFNRRCRELRSLASKRDHWYCEQFK